MAKLIYITNTSLDGYIEDADGSFDWQSSDQVHAFITDLVRPMGTYLYGRRLYETMAWWGAPVDSYPPRLQAFAGVWQRGEKIVFSRTLTTAATPNTRIETRFDVDAIERLKRDATRDIGIGGAGLASVALEAGLVDECHLFLHPVVVGAGKPAFARTVRLRLDLIDTRRFDTGVVHVHHRVRNDAR